MFGLYDGFTVLQGRNCKGKATQLPDEREAQYDENNTDRNSRLTQGKTAEFITEFTAIRQPGQTRATRIAPMFSAAFPQS